MNLINIDDTTFKSDDVNFYASRFIDFYNINCVLKTIHFCFKENNGYTDFFLGFSLYISNTTTKEDGILCFRDTIYTRETMPNPLNISCRLNGRFVIYYNNRTNYPLPPDYSLFAFNNLCEVEVYGNLMVEL